MEDIEQYARVLSQHPDYKVIRRLKPVDVLGHPSQVAIAVLIDTETTGVKQDADKVIEIGAILFEFDPETGELGRVLERYSALEDPGFPIPPESTAIHGITDEMVKGKTFDEAGLRRLCESAQLVIAHNAGFDRPFLEGRFPWFENLAWGCTFRQLPWDEEGIGSGKLEYLAYSSGFFYDAHRAVNDCEALLHVLTRPLPVSGLMPMAVLATKAQQKEFVIHALNSPFESKDALKEKGFRWDAQQKVWKASVDGELAGKELISWLKTYVYSGKQKISLGFEARAATIRYSTRLSKVIVKDV